MDKTPRWTNALAAMFVCLSLVVGMLVILPGEAAAAPPDGYIQGNVNDGVNPLPDSIVVAMPMYGGLEVMVLTDALGDYSIPVPGGLSYGVLAYNDSCYGEMAFVEVSPGEVSYLNFTLENIAPAVTDVTLMGYIQDELGDPVADALVAVYTADPDSMGDGPPLYINMSRTDGAGLYVADILPSVAGGGVAALGIPGYPMTDNQTGYAIVSGMTYWVNLTLEPFAYENDATISGVVTDFDTGLPIQDVMIMVESYNESADESSSNMTWTEADGSYFMEIESGWVRIVMSKPGYTMYMQESVEVLPGEDEIVDGILRAATALIQGNITDRDSGLPIQSARAIIYDPVSGSMNMAFSNEAGFYSLDAFDGTGLIIGAEADGYGGQYMLMDIDPGAELWIDFELRAVDATVSGVVTDAFSGLPVPDASLHFMSPDYDRWESVEPDGTYEMTLVSGEYTVDVNSPSHRQKILYNLTISPGPNVVDVELMPWDLPESVRLYGYVNDSTSGIGIDAASVEVGLGPPDYSEYNQTWTDPSGYYELLIPAVEMIVVASAGGHTHDEAAVDATNETDIRMDFELDMDMWSPNVTYTQTPKENVSWTNPTGMHASVQDVDVRSIALWQFMKNGSGSGFSYYYIIEGLHSAMSPLEQSPNNVPYMQVDDTYFIDYFWSAQPMCGWLTDGLYDLYVPYTEYWMGPEPYSAMRGEYTNSSMSGPEYGTAWFSGDTGEFSFFTFDNGSLATATPDDPTGMISASASMIQVQDGTEMWWWMGGVPMGDWSVVGLMFQRDWIAPSGEYLSLFFANDWAGNGAVNVTLYQVDNDPPVADPGPDLEAVVNTTVNLDGGLSYDNVGIAAYDWWIESDNVSLSGEQVDYVFTEVGLHNVTLTVFDGAGHSDSAILYVDVIGDEPPTADAGSDQEVAIDTVVDFDGTGSSDDVGITNYTWTVVELMEYMYGATPQFTFSDPGVYNVTLVVVDTANQTSVPDTMQVTAMDVTSPVADAGGDQSEMGGVEVVLSGAASWDDVAVVNWTWTFEHMGVPVTLWGEVVSFAFWEEGVYDITLNVSDAAGNWDTDVVQVTISGIIPEFPSLVMPVIAMVALLLFVRFRKRRP